MQAAHVQSAGPDSEDAHQAGEAAHDHPGELGIDLERGENYWSSGDGSNTYLTRLGRFERFCRLAGDLKLRNYYPSPGLLNRNELLGRYYLDKGEVKKAVPYFISAVKKEGRDISIFRELEARCRDAELRDLYKRSLAELTEWKRDRGTRGVIKRAARKPGGKSLFKNYSGPGTAESLDGPSRRRTKTVRRSKTARSR